MKTKSLKTILTALALVTPSMSLAQSSDAADISDADLVGLLGQLRTEVESLRKEIRQFEGAVIAFNRSQTGGQLCPDGWSLFTPAQGRTLIGAGVHNNTDATGQALTIYTSHKGDTSDGQVNSTGGRESVNLTINEMATHNHAVSTSYDLNAHDGLAGGNATTGIDRDYNTRPDGARADHGHGIITGAISMTGSGRPHENRPPYVALYFCERR